RGSRPESPCGTVAGTASRMAACMYTRPPENGSFGRDSHLRGLVARQPAQTRLNLPALGLVLVPRGGRPVGVDDQGPAPAVDRDLVMEPAQKNAVPDAGGAAVGLVP